MHQQILALTLGIVLANTALTAQAEDCQAQPGLQGQVSCLQQQVKKQEQTFSESIQALQQPIAVPLPVQDKSTTERPELV